MKKCPNCAEQIQDEAIVCRFCGREIKPKVYRYLREVYHFRNENEGGWLRAQDSSAAMASQYFWDQWCASLVTKRDENMIAEGWEIAQPRSPACIELGSSRNGCLAIIAVIAAFGGGDTDNSWMWKWWCSAITIRWRIISDNPGEETIHYWINNATNSWQKTTAARK